MKLFSRNAGETPSVGKRFNAIWDELSTGDTAEDSSSFRSAGSVRSYDYRQDDGEIKPVMVRTIHARARDTIGVFIADRIIELITSDGILFALDDLCVAGGGSPAIVEIADRIEAIIPNLIR